MMCKFLKQVMILGLIVGVGIPTMAEEILGVETYFGETGKAFSRQPSAGHGMGLPTWDEANTEAGIFNVEAVFGVFHENEIGHQGLCHDWSE